MSNNVSRCCGEIANNADTFKKSLGLAVAGMNFTSSFVEYSTGSSRLKKAFLAPRDLFSGAKNVVNASAILGRINEWSHPDLRYSILHPWQGKHMWAPVKVRRAIPNSWRWQQLANKVALTAAQSLELTSFIDRNSVNYFGQTALSVGGKLPIFNIVKDFFFALSGFFGCAFSSYELQFAKKCRKIFTKREFKWKSRLELFSGLNEFNYEKVCKKYEEKKKKCQLISDKAVKESRYEKYMNLLTEDATPENYPQRVAAFQDKYAQDLKEKYTGKLLLNGTSEHLIRELKELELKLDRTTATRENLSSEIRVYKKQSSLIYHRLQKACQFEFNIKAIDKNIESFFRHKVHLQQLRKGYAKNLITKSWLSIAASVGKIFLIVIGTALLALSLTVPQLSFLGHPSVRLTMTGCAILSGTFGVAKNLYRDIFYKESNVKIRKKIEDHCQQFRTQVMA